MSEANFTRQSAIEWLEESYEGTDYFETLLEIANVDSLGELNSKEACYWAEAHYELEQEVG